MISKYQHFFRSSSASLVFSFIVANSSYSAYYHAILCLPGLLFTINTDLMTLFFLSLALEIKRACLIGQLRDPRQRLLPIVAALGGACVWLALLKTGIHATLAGIVIGFCIPFGF